MLVLYDAQQGGETSVLSSSSSLVFPDRGQQQEQQHVSVSFASSHFGKIAWICFSVIPNSSFSFLHPQPPSGAGPSPLVGWRRQSAVLTGPASSSSETCRKVPQGNRFQKTAAVSLNLSCKHFLYSHCALPIDYIGIVLEKHKRWQRITKQRWGHSHNSTDVAIAVCFLPPVTFNFPRILPHGFHIAEATVAIWAWDRQTDRQTREIA